MSSSLSLLPPSARQAALATHPDTDRYKCRFDIRSSSSNQVYRISFDSAPNAGYWVCNCRGHMSHGVCKHLTSMGLRGRKFGKDLEWVKKFQLVNK